ncbi:hypothetical protein AB4Z22_18540 [Paenibacillus sp. TAF58]
MEINLFNHQDTIAKNLLTFVRLRGYSRLSLSKITGISRNEIDQLLSSVSPNPNLYHSQIIQITKTFDLPIDYFLITDSHNESPSERNLFEYQRSPKATELLQGLDNVLDIYSMYLD